MPVAKKTASKPATVEDEPVEVAPARKPLLSIGDIIHIVNGGRTLKNYEVLDMDQHFIKVRSDVRVAPQTEIALFPWAQIEAIGLPNER